MEGLSLERRHSRHGDSGSAGRVGGPPRMGALGSERPRKETQESTVGTGPSAPRREFLMGTLGKKSRHGPQQGSLSCTASIIDNNIHSVNTEKQRS